MAGERARTVECSPAGANVGSRKFASAGLLVAGNRVLRLGRYGPGPGLVKRIMSSNGVSQVGFVRSMRVDILGSR
jgi:hypothetical protein